MKVEIEGKTLYRIQNRNMGSDGVPLDAFWWGEHEPTNEDLKRIFLSAYEGYDGDEDALREWLASSEVCPVYAEEV